MYKQTAFYIRLCRRPLYCKVEPLIVLLKNYPFLTGAKIVLFNVLCKKISDFCEEP